jgi:hypothetical protein
MYIVWLFLKPIIAIQIHFIKFNRRLPLFIGSIVPWFQHIIIRLEFSIAGPLFKVS